MANIAEKKLTYDAGAVITDPTTCRKNVALIVAFLLLEFVVMLGKKRYFQITGVKFDLNFN